MKKQIVLAGGCFWGTQALFSRLDAVLTSECGYANSRRFNPSYQQVCTGLTGAAEAVKILYDNEQLSLGELLTLFFKSIDPTSIDRQGGDIGRQYRSGIYYSDEADEPIIQAFVDDIRGVYSMPIVTEILPLENFYSAEEEHQDYLLKNPGGYCHVDLKLAHEFNKN